jgi:hypothetical protein
VPFGMFPDPFCSGKLFTTGAHKVGRHLCSSVECNCGLVLESDYHSLLMDSTKMAIELGCSGECLWALMAGRHDDSGSS